MEPSSNYLVLRSENGGFNSVVFWETRLVFHRNDTATLFVQTSEQQFEGRLSKEQVLKLKEFLEQILIFSLPSTDYDTDLSDDSTNESHIFLWFSSRVDLGLRSIARARSLLFSRRAFASCR
jgi:hypothetical protein